MCTKRDLQRHIHRRTHASQLTCFNHVTRGGIQTPDVLPVPKKTKRGSRMTVQHGDVVSPMPIRNPFVNERSLHGLTIVASFGRAVT